MSLAMTTAEREAFLADVHVGVLSIPDGDRGPLAAPIWYDVQDGNIVVLTQSTSRKGRLLTAGRRVTLTAQRETAPYAYVSVEGPVTAIEPYDLDGDLLAMAIRYLGPDQGRAYVEGSRPTWNSQTSIKVTVAPARWLTVDYAKRGG